MFLTIARLGCLSGGCCYGRPSRIGLAYGIRHAGVIPAAFLGVPLFPLPILESAVSASALAIAWTSHTSDAVAFFAAARFFLDDLRGEPARARIFSLTEVQWASLAILLCTSPWAAAACAAISNLYRPAPPDELLQLTQALRALRVPRAIAETAAGLTITRRQGRLVILHGASPARLRQLSRLEPLVCDSRTQ
jgi:hypothetical protein